MNKISKLSLFRKGRGEKKYREKKPENIFYSPADNMSPLWQYVGLALRTLVLFVGVFGITAFICGAAELTESEYWNAVVVSPWSIALLCLPVAAACAIASLGRLPAIITPFAYTGIYMGVCAIAYGNPIDFTVKSALRIYNLALYNVSTRGYYSFGNYMVNDGYDYTTAGTALSDPYRFAGAFLLATLIGFILYFCIQKRTRIFPIVVLMSAVFAPILTYNLAVGNAGIAFMLVFICAALGLKVYDYRYCGKAERKAAKKKLRSKKRLEKEKKKAERKEKRAALKKEADGVFDKAIDADMPLRKARQARLAVYKNHRISKKTAKKAAKADKKVQKKKQKAEKKERALRIKNLKKQLSSLPKGSAERQSIIAKITAEGAPSAAKKEEKKNRRAAIRAEKKATEKRYRKNSFAGGYAGFGIALVAFLAVWLPLAIADQPFAEIKPINSRVQATRAYVTAYLRGSDVDLNDPYAYGIYGLNPRKLSFDPVDLDDKKMFTVDTDGTSNIYLRSWVATDFDWKTNSWISSDFEDIHRYREKFGNDFTPDSIKTDFYKYVYPSSAIIDEEDTYKNFTKYGFTVQQVDVWRVRGQSLLLFVPSHMNTDKGLFEYKDLNEDPYKYQNYYEGTYTSFFYRYGRGYSTISYVTALNRADTAKSIDDSITYYQICKNHLSGLSGEITDDIIYETVTECENQFAELGIEYQGTSLVDRYFNEMTDADREALRKSFETEERYRKSIVEPLYTVKAENEVIAEIALGIQNEAIEEKVQNGGLSALTVHESVMAVVDYFRSDEFYYTETPNADLTNGKKPVIEAFLTDVKQGYCSHFASAAVFLLREMGVPCRYVEGYVATDLEPLGTTGSKHRTDVYGTDAHAWIEVYMDGMGWMQYEVTQGQLCDDMYDPNSDTFDPDMGNNDQEEDNTPKPPVGGMTDNDQKPPQGSDFEVEEEISDLQYLLYGIIGLLCLAAIGVLIWLLIRFIRGRAVAAMDARYKVIDEAKDRDAYLKPETDRHHLARSINDWIFEVYSTIGCEPRAGELPEEFAARMHEDYGDLSTVDVRDVVFAMQKEEFGHGLTFEEQNNCAKYLEDIITSVYAGMNPLQKIINRYIKRKI